MDYMDLDVRCSQKGRSTKSLTHSLIVLYFYNCKLNAKYFTVLQGKHVAGLVQNCSISGANALDILQACT